MSEFTIKIVLVCILLFLSAFFSCSETAFFSLTRAELDRLKKSRKGYAKSLIKLLQKPRNLLITILLGNELVNVALAITVASAVYDILDSASWQVVTLVSILITAPVVMIFGEMIPKNIAVRYAMALAPIFIVPVRIFSQVFFPVRYVLTKFADSMVLLFGGDPSQVRSMIMEEEFRQLVDLGYKEGALEEGESELIHRIFELGNKNVSKIMTPVSDIFRLPLSYPIEKIVHEMRETQYNRVPVYRNNQDDIVGVLHSREVFRLYRGKLRGHIQEVDEIVRPVHFVRDDVCIEGLLGDFQRLKIHIAVVYDKNRRLVGLVTMDDIFRLLFTEKLGWKKGDQTYGEVGCRGPLKS